MPHPVFGPRAPLGPRRGGPGRSPPLSAADRIRGHPLAFADPFLAREVNYGRVHHVVSGVAASYSTAAKAYIAFCDVRNLQPWPVDEVQLAGFIHIICQRVSTQSLNMYLSGIRHAHENECGTWRLEGNELIRRTIRYVKRRYPSATVMSKLPISLGLLRRLLPHLEGWPDLSLLSREDFAFALASLVAVSAFLRGGEFTTCRASSRSILLRSSLCVRLITADGTDVRALVVSVPQPKTQWQLRAVDVPCFQCPEAGAFDVVALWEAWCVRFPTSGPGEPAFSGSDGAALSRDYMVSRTAELMALANIPSVDSSGRPLALKAASWRAGAVRSALDAKLSESMIMEYGRWKSVAWRHYLMHTPYDLLSAARGMVRASVADPGGPQRVGSSEAVQLGVVVDVQVVRRSERVLRQRSLSNVS
jgi:hypothetical protein